MQQTRVERVLPFEQQTERYDAWFGQHEAAYRSELAALGPLIDKQGPGLEVGVGTGRFARPLGVEYGLDPAREMVRLASERGIQTVQGVGEALPFQASSFGLVLIVVTLCFLDDADAALIEARRVLMDNGRLVLGFIDRDKPFGQGYKKRRATNPFYAPASFYTETEARSLLERQGFKIEQSRQALFGQPDDLTSAQTARQGTEEGSFLALKACL